MDLGSDQGSDNRQMNSVPEDELALARMAVPFHARLLPSAELPALLRSPNTLAAFTFGAPGRGECPQEFRVGLPLLAGDYTEVWHSPETVKAGQDGNLSWTANSQVLCGHVWIDDASADLAQVTEDVYRQIMGEIHRRGYPHLLRVWNYFPNINDGDDDQERYKQFCLGRHRGMQVTQDLEPQLPAATAIGSHVNGLFVAFLASRSPGDQIENPRQVSAYRYPRQYGPRSPSFARATLKSWGNAAHLYISGTASVVGHESVHPGDLDSQIRETGRNIQVLLRHAVLKARDLGEVRMTDLSLLRVYMRHPEHVERAREILQGMVGIDIPAVYVHGDICRRDLLIEIEGLYATGIG